MPTPRAVGTAEPKAGRTTYGTLDVLDLPTGGAEQLPVAIVQGRGDGPCVWLVSNIHGGEVTGTAVLHSLLQETSPEAVAGTLVVLPTLNPGGMRAGTRTAPYDGRDPNRSFPGRRKESGEEYFPSVYEQVAARIFEVMRESADCLVDLHNAQLRSMPYAIRDRVLYRSERERGDAERLATRLEGMVAAFGALVVNEDLPVAYVSKELHRSTAGAALNEARIPAFTAELGGTGYVDRAGYEAGLRGVRSVLRWAGALRDGGELLAPPPTPHPVRSIDHPRAAASGVVRRLVEPGDRVRAGEPVATLSDAWGRPLGEGVVRTRHEGWVTGLTNGSLAYPHAPLATLAVRDEEPLVAPWPET